MKKMIYSVNLFAAFFNWKLLASCDGVEYTPMIRYKDKQGIVIEEPCEENEDWHFWTVNVHLIKGGVE